MQSNYVAKQAPLVSTRVYSWVEQTYLVFECSLILLLCQKRALHYLVPVERIEAKFSGPDHSNTEEGLLKEISKF